MTTSVYLMVLGVLMAALAGAAAYMAGRISFSLYILNEHMVSLKNAHRRIRELEDASFEHEKLLTRIVEFIKLENEERKQEVLGRNVE